MWLQAVVRRKRGCNSSQAWRAQRGTLGDEFFFFCNLDESVPNQMVNLATTLLAVAAKECPVPILIVSNMCETNGWFWFCVGMAILTVLSSGLFVNPKTDDGGRLKDTDENAA